MRWQPFFNFERDSGLGLASCWVLYRFSHLRECQSQPHRNIDQSSRPATVWTKFRIAVASISRLVARWTAGTTELNLGSADRLTDESISILSLAQKSEPERLIQQRLDRRRLPFSSTAHWALTHPVELAGYVAQ